MTLPTVITHIQNKGYVEGLKKSYSLISNITAQAANDLGLHPQYWETSVETDGDPDDTLNRNIVAAYKKHMNIAKDFTDKDYNYYQSKNSTQSYKYLNGETNPVSFYSGNGIFKPAYFVELTDGSTIGFIFSRNKRGGVLWNLISKRIRIAFIVDVNGAKKPNQIGRDIFWFVLYNNGKLLPYDTNDTSDCNINGKGYSCAARIINEGKMNY